MLKLFQHSLMNLGVETQDCRKRRLTGKRVSAFSDESWGGDPPRDGYIGTEEARFSIL